MQHPDVTLDVPTNMHLLRWATMQDVGAGAASKAAGQRFLGLGFRV